MEGSRASLGLGRKGSLSKNYQIEETREQVGFFFWVEADTHEALTNGNRAK